MLFAFDGGGPARAQVRIGEFELHQPGASGAVGFVACNADRTVEWWAYIDGTYSWGDASSTTANPWKLEAVRLGDTTASTFMEWRAEVLALSVMAGKRVVFQNHSVVETTVDN